MNWLRALVRAWAASVLFAIWSGAMILVGVAAYHVAVTAALKAKGIL